MALATQADVEARLERDLTAAEVARLPSLLDDASDAVIGYCNTDFERVYTATIAADDDTVTTDDTHRVVLGDRVEFSALAGGTGLVVETTYHVNEVPTSDTFTLSATARGATIDVTTDATAATLTVLYPLAVVRVVSKMVARSLFRSQGDGVVEQQNTGPFGVKFSSAASSGDVWLTKADKMALRPHRLGGGLTSVGLVGSRYELG